jgi:pyruvate-formate lyase-activating enzyme
MKCNLDCSYCPSDLYGGHDNSTRHPALEQCLPAIDFMFEYADIYMSTKPRGIRYVILNVYGGEALHHPRIVEILSAVRERYRPYQSRWHLTVTTTTNAVIPPHRLEQIIPLIDEFTVSYHTECTAAQKQLFQENVLRIKTAGCRVKCVVLMHSDEERFQDAQQQISWLQQHDIRHLPKQLDHPPEQDFNYNQHQVVWFEKLYQTSLDHAVIKDHKVDLADTGRGCCGGRQLCENQDFKNAKKFVHNKFPGWYCSVNRFFVYIKQVTGEVFVNKDCKMNYNGTVGPIGNLNDVNSLLAQARDPNLPIIRCAKSSCNCGLCAPKAANLDTYQTIMRKYEIPNSDLLQKS